MSDYEKISRQIKLIEEENQKYLDLFSKWLEDKGLSKKTIQNHVSNVHFYINNFLCYYEPQTMDHGTHCTNDFLGNWFIRKAMWASPSTIRSNTVSLKKFYECMALHGFVSGEDVAYLKSDISANLDSWIKAVKQYDADLEDY